MAYGSVFDYRRALRPGGVFALVGGATSTLAQTGLLGPLLSRVTDARFGLVMHKANRDLPDLTELLEAGKLVPVIDRTYPLAETAEAFRHFGTGAVKGKIVITVGNGR